MKIAILVACTILVLSEESLAIKPAIVPKIKLIDYTARRCATHDVWNGKFSRGLSVVPEKHLPLSFLLIDKLAGLDSKLDWHLSAAILESDYHGTIACFDEPYTKRSYSAVIHFRDLKAGMNKNLHLTVKDRFLKQSKPLYLIYSDPSKKFTASTFVCDSYQDFAENWKTNTPPSAKYRFLFTDNLVWLSAVPEHAILKRKKTVSQFISESNPLVRRLAENFAGNKLTARLYKTKMDLLFKTLNDLVLIDDKLKSYELHWSVLRNSLGDETQIAMASSLEAFHADLLAAVENAECTVRVSTSDGVPADIHFAKQGNRFRSLGMSITFGELERADYNFRAYRGGKLIGETINPVPCTGETKDVTVPVK